MMRKRLSTLFIAGFLSLSLFIGCSGKEKEPVIEETVTEEPVITEAPVITEETEEPVETAEPKSTDFLDGIRDSALTDEEGGLPFETGLYEVTIDIPFNNINKYLVTDDEYDKDIPLEAELNIYDNLAEIKLYQKKSLENYKDIVLDYMRSTMDSDYATVPDDVRNEIAAESGYENFDDMVNTPIKNVENNINADIESYELSDDGDLYVCQLTYDAENKVVYDEYGREVITLDSDKPVFYIFSDANVFGMDIEVELSK